ncbi:hypothetical protein GCM10014715_32580 [Streptomyces spiralis]|uniref:Uncharacterized protein n=1 Tax=Streptomyces spiralis TaxID=66376 RepID=A0A918ZYN7_9ACTN|nr:hypothetical protein GCM10014715_32580 [Streptomyces spiralis]
MAGMPGLLVALVPSGAQVITVTVPSPEPPVAPGTTPQPAASDAHAASAPADRRALRLPAGRVGAGRFVLRVRRLPVMHTHDSRTSLTME